MKDNAFRVDSVYSKAAQNPLLLKFQNGLLRSNIQNSCGLYSNKKNKSTRRCLITVDNQLYAGDEEDSELHHSFVLVKNKRTGKARLIEVGAVVAKAIVEDDIKDINTNDEKEEVKSTAYDLNRAFGSKKQVRRTEQKLKMAVNMDILDSQLTETVDHVDQSTNDLEQFTSANDNSSVYLPAINRNAQIVEDVYNIQNILDKNAMATIKEELHGVDYLQDMVPYISRIAEKKVFEAVSDRCCLLLYADALIQFYLLDSKTVTAFKYVASYHSDTLNKIILDNFLIVNGNKRTRPIQMRDKTACYIMVLLLLTCGYKFDFGTLEVVLKRKLATLLRMVGAQVIKDGNDSVAELKIPLPSLGLKRIRKKK